MQEIAAEVPIATTDRAMTVKHQIENWVDCTYGSPEAAAGWPRSGVARLPIETIPVGYSDTAVAELDLDVQRRPMTNAISSRNSVER
jgi:hypothetical protein